MKVTADALIGSADRMRNQRQREENAPAGGKGAILTDSVTISGRLSSRLDTMEGEFREIQSSLTQNQIIRDGLDRLRQDLTGGGSGQQQILEEVNFNGQPVLRQFVGGANIGAAMETLMARNTEALAGDMERLRRLQVELDNIVASDLVGEDRAGAMIQDVEASLAKAGQAGMEAISAVQPDAVMRLIR